MLLVTVNGEGESWSNGKLSPCDLIGYGFERAVEVAYITSLWDIVLPQILCQCEMLCAPDCLVTVNDTDLK